MTFRMRGHEEASGTKYVPKALMDQWAKKDPVENFENFLKEQNILNQEKIDHFRESIQKEIDQGLTLAFSENEIDPLTSTELKDLYSPYNIIEKQAETSSKSKSDL